MKEGLLAAARALDGDGWTEARERLRAVPLMSAEPPQRLVAFALWRRILAYAGSSESWTDERQARALAALDGVRAAVMDASGLWNGYRSIPALERQIGAVDAAAIVATMLWDRILSANETLFEGSLELFFRGNGERCVDAFIQFLTRRRSYVPSYWHFALLTKTIAGDHGAFHTLAARIQREADREDLVPLFDLYLTQMRQAPVADIVAGAIALRTPAHRARVADYMTGMGYTQQELPLVVDAFPLLVEAGAAGNASIHFMNARLANAKARWQDVLELAPRAAREPKHLHAANLLRANALARTNRINGAREIIETVTADPEAVPFLKSRAAFIGVTAALIRDGIDLPETSVARPFPPNPGRPLAQSLWVGHRLRWIERLAIKSFLDQGWRFQLYVYEDVENVPDGCEVLDASAIIPARQVFREGMNSGLHAGSVGAFSDLFRYRLLYERGGMWTDTDVINFKKFDPDGRRFVSTETSDAGLITLNGAIMAAPSGDKFLAMACERADALLRSPDMFFTRIGPYLIAEIFAEMGTDSLELMPLGFLSPVDWMNTGSLLQPYEQVAARPEFRNAVNLHVYTEMWRTLGLGLDRPPHPATYLGRLYADHFPDTVRVSELADHG